MKAWVVDDWQYEHSVVVFHNHGLAARRIGAEKLDDEFGTVHCRRATEFDEYAEQGEVPLSVLIDNGWWYQCDKCPELVTSDDEDRYIEDAAQVCICGQCRAAERGGQG